MPGRSLTWLVLLALAVLVLMAGGPAVLAKARSLPETMETKTTGGQSASQISSSEFAAAEVGAGTAALRAMLGEPEAKSVHDVEGLELECWYYGAGSATGAYQLCFENGRLRTKAEYTRGA
jgi:hypothetical protein